MKNINGQQGEHIIWEINKTKANIARQRRQIELLKLYNEQEEKKLAKLTSYETEISYIAQLFMAKEEPEPFNKLCDPANKDD